MGSWGRLLKYCEVLCLSCLRTFHLGFVSYPSIFYQNYVRKDNADDKKACFNIILEMAVILLQVSRRVSFVFKTTKVSQKNKQVKKYRSLISTMQRCIQTVYLLSFLSENEYGSGFRNTFSCVLARGKFPCKVEVSEVSHSLRRASAIVANSRL